MSSNALIVRSITTYCGIPIFVGGTLCNLLNVYCLWQTRRNPCGFLFIVSSFVDCLVLFYGLLTRILIVGFNLDWANTNFIWCKTRVAFTESSFLISLTLICLSSIDRLFNSCRRASFRNLSRLGTAQLTVVITIMFWLIHSISTLVLTNLIKNPITNLTICDVPPNSIFDFYRFYIGLPLYLGVFPSAILLSTGFMTFYNITKMQALRQRQLIQRQLTLMMLLQIPIVVLSTLPYIIFSEYMIITAKVMKSSYQRNIESLILNIVTLLFYVAFTCQFFVFFISSPKFRERTTNIFLCCKRNILTSNRVQPQILIIKRNQ